MESVATFVKKVVRKISLLSWLPRSTWLKIDGFLVRRALERSTGSPSPGVIVIAPPGGGNIGDQALVESIIEGIDECELSIVVRDSSDFTLLRPDARPHTKVTVLEFPGLIYGGMVAHFRAVYKLAALGAPAHLAVIGADIMDGAYNPRASLSRAAVVTAFSSNGVPCSVLGFSWNANPDVRALRAIRDAGDAGVSLLVRDGVSLRRLREQRIANLQGVADLVFTSDSIDTSVVDSDEVGLTSSSGAGHFRSFAVVNVSGLINKDQDMTGEFVKVCQHLQNRGMKVVLLPHVSRPGADDIPACRKLAEALANDRDVAFIDRLLTPRQVRGLVRGAHVVVTGRMHLAVMAMRQGVPAIALATQGKVEGLMEHFGTPELCVSPTGAIADSVIELLESLDSPNSELRVTLGRRVPEVVGLAEVNLRSLMQHDVANVNWGY